MTWTAALWAQSSRFIIDDDAYSDRVVRAAQRLLREHKLLSLGALQTEVRTEGFPLRLPPLSREKLEPPELCDRLRESTLAVGTFYKCPDCGGWHFSASTGFVVGENGIICTCCHVILGEDERIKEAYLIAADASGSRISSPGCGRRRYRSRYLPAACGRHRAEAFAPAPRRPGRRAGVLPEPPGRLFFMFTQGLVSRLNRRTNADTDQNGQPNSIPSRPVLLLNITAEFAPGSSGAPVVDPCGNVVGQVDSIADAGEAASDDENQPPSPSVPIRFCTATEEILRLANPNLARESRSPLLKPAKSQKKKRHQLSPLSLKPGLKAN